MGDCESTSRTLMSLCSLYHGSVVARLRLVEPTCRIHRRVSGEISLCYGIDYKSTKNVILQIQHER